jgi:hypothetical protein
MSAVKATHGSSTKLVTTAHTVFQFEVFYSTQYHSVVVRWYYRFFLFFAMGKMVICSMNIIWKIFPPHSIHLVTRTHTILHF